MRQTDVRQTDVRQKHRLMPLPYGGGGITNVNLMTPFYNYIPLALALVLALAIALGV